MKRAIAWINRTLTHNRDDEGDFGVRALMHLPIGILMGVPILGLPVLWLFIRYEQNEDRHVKDEAWKDYYGALVGAAATTLAVIGIIIWRVATW